MNITKIKNSAQVERGFTIVELLIVVVVIAILAAITIVSYNGITNRANASAAEALATTIAKKAELFAADGPTGKYPVVTTDLTGPGSTTYGGIATTSFTTAALTASNGTNTVNYQKCGTGGTPAAVTAATVTGGRILYFNYSTGSGTLTKTIGQDTGANIACYTV